MLNPNDSTMNNFLGVEWNEFAPEPGNAEACELALNAADQGTRRYLPCEPLDNLPEMDIWSVPFSDEDIETQRMQDNSALESVYMGCFGVATMMFVFGVLPIRCTIWEGIWATLAIQFFSTGVLLSCVRDRRGD